MIRLRSAGIQTILKHLASSWFTRVFELVVSVPNPTSRLRLFGGAVLETDRGAIGGRSAQRRRRALLALLAVEARPITREKLIGYLWEEADTESARKLLSESMYVIRKALGEDVLLTAHESVQLNCALVWSDVAAFTAAIEAGDDEAAVALYRGPFLDGFFLDNAYEFDNWVEAERARFAALRAAALERLAAAAEARADYSGAVAWWRELTQHDPYNAAYATGLMRALDGAGDRAGALRQARVHAELLRADFDAEPDPNVTALAQTLQSSPHARPARVTRASPVHETLSEQPPASTSGAPRRRVRVLQIALLLVVVVAVGYTAVWLKRPSRAQAGGASGSRVVVLPFNVRGSAGELRDGIADLLSTDLHGAGDLRAVDSHAVLSYAADQPPIAPHRALAIAERFGADYYILGDVVEAGGQLQINATMYNASDGSSIGSAAARGRADSLLVLVDAIAAQLLTQRGVNANELAQLALSTTRSYPALKHYLAGEHHFRSARYELAAAEFARALGDDPDFALAHYRLSAAAEWNFEFMRARTSAERALANSARLPDQYQPLVRAWRSFLIGNASDAQRTYESVLALYPSSVEAWSGLGEVLVHFNPTRGLPQDEAREAFAQVLQFAPDYGEVRYHALEFAARDGHAARFDSLFAGLDRKNPQHGSWLAVRAFTFGTAAEKLEVLDKLSKSNELSIGIAAARLAAHTHNFDAATRIAQQLTRPTRTHQWQAGGHLMIAEIQMALGDEPAAQRALVSAASFEPDWPLELAALFSLHPSSTASRADLERHRNALLAWQPDAHSPSATFFLAAHAGIHKQLRLYLLGLLSTRLGDLEQAQSYRRELEALPGSPESTRLAAALARSVSGHMARARGQNREALRLLMSAGIDAPPEFVMLSPFYSRAHDRFTIAEINRELGNIAEARRWYGSLVDGYDFLYAPAAQSRLKTL